MLECVWGCLKVNSQTIYKNLVKEIKEMPTQDLKIVSDFVDYLREKELEDDILNSKTLIKSVKKSQKAWKNGKNSDFISWEDLRKKI